MATKAKDGVEQIYIYARDAHDRRACIYIYLPKGSTVEALAKAIKWYDRKVKVNVDEETGEFKLVPFLAGSLVEIARRAVGSYSYAKPTYNVDPDTVLEDNDRVTFCETWDPRLDIKVKGAKA